MSLYCEKCRRVFEEYRCPVCGSIGMRSPGEDDFCFLTEQEAGHAGLIGETLRGNGIPFEMKSTACMNPDKCTFYVYYDQLERAREITDALDYTAGADAEPEYLSIEDMAEVEVIELPDVYKLGEKTREELIECKEMLTGKFREYKTRARELLDVMDEIDLYLED